MARKPEVVHRDDLRDHRPSQPQAVTAGREDPDGAGAPTLRVDKGPLVLKLQYDVDGIDSVTVAAVWRRGRRVTIGG